MGGTSDFQDQGGGGFESMESGIFTGVANPLVEAMHNKHNFNMKNELLPQVYLNQA